MPDPSPHPHTTASPDALTASRIPPGPSLSLLFPTWGRQGHSGTQGGRVGATHVIEHFVELLGVHDKVGVAYHVVDCVCLDRRETEDMSAQQAWLGSRSVPKGNGQVLPLEASATLSGKTPLSPDFCLPFGSLLPLREAFGCHPLGCIRSFIFTSLFVFPSHSQHGLFLYCH